MKPPYILRSVSHKSSTLSVYHKNIERPHKWIKFAPLWINNNIIMKLNLFIFYIVCIITAIIFAALAHYSFNPIPAEYFHVLHSPHIFFYSVSLQYSSCKLFFFNHCGKQCVPDQMASLEAS